MQTGGMSRPLRIEFPGALYHVTSRGNRRSTIYADEVDRRWWLFLLGETCSIFKFTVYAYCQMGNHYHLLLRTHAGRLSRGMRYLNGEYSRHYNLRHAHVGHLFEGRYKAIICSNDQYLHRLCRYILLNPVRARLVATPEEWEWSSYLATISNRKAPTWLDVGLLLRQYAEDPSEARRAFRTFVLDGFDDASPLAAVRSQIVLGDPEVIREHALRNQEGLLQDLSRAQRQLLVKPLADFFAPGVERGAAMAAAFSSLGYTMGEIARFCHVSTKTVSRAIQKHKLNSGR